ncbi:MAG: hypothetical protein AAF696_28895 [Bacteroidota bacterium]
MRKLRKIAILFLGLVLLASMIAFLYLSTGMKALPATFTNTAFTGTSLYQSIEKYASFGVHRMASPNDSASIDWVASEMAAKGFEIDFQTFSSRQFFLEEAHLQIAEDEYECVPQWWIPEFSDSLKLQAPLVEYQSDRTDYSNKIVFLVHPMAEFGAYLGEDLLAKVKEIAERGAIAIIAAIEGPSSEIYLYNVKPDGPQLPIPVLMVAAKHQQALRQEAIQEETLSLRIKGHYKPNASTKNIIATRGNPEENVIIVSTPLSGWFVNAAERGPGISIFLALADWIHTHEIEGNFLFVASGGHELTHMGADRFLKELAPKPANTKCWIHLGASLTAYEWESANGRLSKTQETNINQKVCSFSNNNIKLYWHYWRSLGWIPFPAFMGAVGEIKDVKAHGYKNYIGFGGKHTYFHTPKDNLDCVSPEILEPLGESMLHMFWQILND